MPSRIAVSKELSEILKLIAHPDRIRLIEELRHEEHDVTSLSKQLDIPQTRISQHLAQLRAFRLVNERREGRRHFYSLATPELAQWIINGIDLLKIRPSHLDLKELDEAKELWS